LGPREILWRAKGILVRRLLFQVCFGILCLFGAGAVAVAGDASSDLGNLFAEHYEFRLGGFAHGVGGVESGSVDVNAELIFPQLWPNIVAPSWNWLVPRPHIGVSVNTAGKTDYGFAGGLWSFNVTRRFFVETFVGGAVHDGTINGDPNRAALGSRVLFHVGGSVGYRLTDNWNVLFTFEHLSNGNAALHAAPSNQGLNEYGLRVGYLF